MKYLLAILLVLCFCASGWAVTTASGAWMTPTANYDTSAWTKCDSSYLSDDKWAASTAATAAFYGLYGFGFVLGATSTYDSVDVLVEGHGLASGTAARTIYVWLSTDSGKTGTGDSVVCVLPRTDDGLLTLTGTTNRKWGTSFTQAQIEAASFGVRIRDNSTATSSVMSIDQVKIRIWWQYNGTKAHFIFGRGQHDMIDLFLSQEAPTTNYATGYTMYFLGGRGGPNEEYTVLLGWKGLKDSLYNRVVDSAKLTIKITIGNGSYTASPVAGFHVQRRTDWDTATATWNIYKTANNWGTAGCLNTTSDITATVYDSVHGNTWTSGTFNTLTMKTAFQAVDATDTTSAGFTLTRVAGNDEQYSTFPSGNNPVIDDRPYLEVWTSIYTPPATTAKGRARRTANSRW